MAAPPPLPLDLLRPILSHISDKETLLTLCLISKTFLHEAQQCLWATVSLRSAAIASFCLAMSTSPALGRAVRRLSMQLANDLSPSALDNVARALHLLPNLHALEITPPHSHHWTDTVLYPTMSWRHDTASRILHGAAFRLTLFRSAFRITDADFMVFLGEQPGIEELVLFSIARHVVRLKGRMLPRLRMFRSPVQWLELEVEGDGAQGKGERVFHQERVDIMLPLRGVEDNGMSMSL